MIAVVIPYFQREPGVLRKALASVAAQRGCRQPIEVLVVDDASPVRAAGEVGTMPSVRVVTQSNSGPGAARNTGLDNLHPDTRLVAFLDSDDEWSPDHLARAEAALGAGHDFYFADHFQLGQTVGAFARGGRIRPAEHAPLPGAEGLHAYRGDMLDQIIRGNVIGTSTVVYDARRFPAQRFRVEFTNAGEDYLFWMDLARVGARCCFSSQVEATYGRGVNVYSGAGWGTEQHMLRVHNELRFKKTVAREFELGDEQRALIRTHVAALRQAFAGDLLHRLSHRQSTSTALLLAHLKLDPLSYLQLPATVWAKLVRRA